MNETNPVAEIATLVKKSFSDLTTQQKQRYAHVRGIYVNDEESLNLILLLEPRGGNSWKSVTDKIDNIDRGDYKMQMYHDALYDNFEIGVTYTSDDIIRIIGQVRRDMGLQTYISSLKKNCESDFNQLYIVHTITTDVCCDGNDEGGLKMKKLIVGYRPMFRLKPQE